MKNIKKVIATLLVITTLTGCVKYNNTMTINDDKSMVFEGSYMVSDQLLKAMDSNNTDGQNSTLLDDEIKTKLEKRGITASDKKENGYTGITINKRYANIDEISNETGKEVVISDYLQDDFDESIFFKVEKGFLKNKYTATFKYDSNVQDENSNLTSDITNDSITTRTATTTTPEISGSIKIPDISSEDDSTTTIPDDNNDYSGLMALAGEMEFTFKVNLPEAVLSSNASKTENDNKTLIWNIENNKETRLEFVFEVKNMTNYYILYGGIAVVAIIIIILIITFINKNKKDKVTNPIENKPIHTDYDPSIEQTLLNPAISSTPNNNVVGNQMSMQNQAPVENKPTFISPEVQTEAYGPIGNNNTESTSYILPEQLPLQPQQPVEREVQTQVQEQMTAGPQTINEIPQSEPVTIKTETSEIQMDRPDTIDINQN